MSVRRRWLAVLVAAAALVLGAGAVGPAPAGADPDPTLVDQFDAAGVSTIGSIKASVPIGPTTLTETLDLVTLDVVDGTMPIPSRQVQFDALGFIPLRATVSLVQAGPVTGAITAQDDLGHLAVTAHVAYTIKISNVSVYVFGGWVPLFVGNNCQTVKPVAITVATPAGQSFDVVVGGPVSGTYTIGDFQNCAPLELPDFFGVGSLPINALVPGSNNTISLQLSNGRFGG